MRTFKLVAMVVFSVAAVAALIFGFWDGLRPLPVCEQQLGVSAPEFERPTKSAMDLLNHAAGCKFLVAGDDVLILPANGEPCGEAFHLAIEDGHSAGAYRCEKSRFEIHVSLPGDIHTQLCIVAHELGHVAGLEDRLGAGIMNQRECPEHVFISDFERSYLRDRFGDI